MDIVHLSADDAHIRASDSLPFKVDLIIDLHGRIPKIEFSTSDTLRLSEIESRDSRIANVRLFCTFTCCIFGLADAGHSQAFR